MENNETIEANLDTKPQISPVANAQPDNQHEWCFAWMPETPPVEGAERAALIKDFKWPKQSQITISFLDGSPVLHQRVMNTALKWTAPGLANLTLIFRNDTTDTDIRISFKYTGSWSTIGTSCKNITNKNEPTMNYGWLTENSTDEELERVVLHEFGHALGLTHEHMNPGGQIPWNRNQVEKDLSGPPNNWSPEVIENNMFRTFSKAETNFTALDSKSIMMYPIPARWTTNGFSVGLNSQLSETDKSFIKQEYQ